MHVNIHVYDTILRHIRVTADKQDLWLWILLQNIVTITGVRLEAGITSLEPID